jgi:hypothetical protein
MQQTMAFMQPGSQNHKKFGVSESVEASSDFDMGNVGQNQLQIFQCLMMKVIYIMNYLECYDQSRNIKTR